MLDLFEQFIEGLLFWINLFEYGPRLWFYPLIDMKHSEYEILYFLFFLPCILSITSIHTLVIKHYYKLRYLVLIGILSIWSPDKDIKFGMVMIGLSLSLTTVMATWFHSERRMEKSIIGLLLALLALMSINFASYSLLPLWTNKNISIGFTVFCVVSFFLVPKENLMTSIEKQDREPNTTFLQLLRRSSAMGASLFSICVFLSNYGIQSRWVEIQPYPSSIIVIISLILGILCYNLPIVSTIKWYFLGLFGAIVFVSFNYNDAPFEINCIKFAGGAITCFYISSAWFNVAKNFIRRRSFFSIFFSIGILIAFTIFFAVYIVAYKFVPYGWVFRERHISMVMVNLALIGWGHTEKKETQTKEKSQNVRNFEYKKFLLFTILVVVLVVVPCVIYRANLQAKIKPTVNKEDHIKAGVWAVHFGYRNDADYSFQDIADFVKEKELNVLGIVESDLTRIMTGNRDLVDYLEQSLNMYSDFGPSTAQNTWGCAILTSYPIVSVRREILPSPEGELACFLDAVLDVNGNHTHFFVTHFGNTEDELDRELQSQRFAAIVNETQGPIVVLGYFVTNYKEDKYPTLVSTGLNDTSTSYDRYCLYIFYRDIAFRQFLRYSAGQISDTELQIGHFYSDGREQRAEDIISDVPANEASPEDPEKNLVAVGSQDVKSETHASVDADSNGVAQASVDAGSNTDNQGSVTADSSGSPQIPFNSDVHEGEAEAFKQQRVTA